MRSRIEMTNEAGALRAAALLWLLGMPLLLALLLGYAAC
jgi:hypothetical protein